MQGIVSVSIVSWTEQGHQTMKQVITADFISTKYKSEVKDFVWLWPQVLLTDKITNFFKIEPLDATWTVFDDSETLILTQTENQDTTFLVLSLNKLYNINKVILVLDTIGLWAKKNLGQQL